MDFNGKNVVFVAGLGGIGYETCKQLLTKPIASLYIFDVIENANAVQVLQAINTKCKVRFIKFDITNKVSIQNALKTVVAEVKYIDILINGAGIVDENNYERMLEINLTGLITTTFEALPYMDKQKRGRGGLVVNIASVTGFDPLPSVVVYSTSKYAVVGFTRAMAEPLYYNLTGVAFTAICPGITQTTLRSHGLKDHTFEYGQPLVDQIFKAKSQTPATCAEHFLRIIEANKNGSLWISDGELREVELKHYWKPTIIA